MERDRKRFNKWAVESHFNSHAHVERDGIPQPYLQILTNFNSHAHVERDYFWGERMEHEKEFQLTRSRGAWRLYGLQCQSKGYISTHTLTWSVTTKMVYIVVLYQISTHTLTWSVTSGNIGGMVSSAISTHTLTWSVTILVKIRWVLSLFQLTRSRGAWLYRLDNF